MSLKSFLQGFGIVAVSNTFSKLNRLKEAERKGIGY